MLRASIVAFLSPILLGQAGDTARLRASQSAVDTAYVGAPVVVFDDTLFVLYGSLGPFGPRERATAAASRIRQYVSAPAAEADTIALVSQAAYSEIVAGDVVLMTVLDADARPLDRTRAEVADDYRRAIRSARSVMGRKFTTRAILLGVVYLLVTTAALILILRLLSSGFPRLYDRTEAIRDRPRVSLRIQRFELISAARIADALLLLARGARVALTILLLYVYVPLVLSFFPWTQGLSRRIVGYAVTPLQSAWTAFVNYLPNVFYIIVIVFLTRLTLRAVQAVFRAVGQGSITLKGFHREWAEPTYKIVRFFVLVFTVIVVFPYLPGAHTDAFRGVSLFLGVLLSFGSSAAIGNVMAGVVLTYTRAFRAGDRVKIGDTVGDVMERTLLVTRVRTIKNEEVTIPNGAVLGGHVVNYSGVAAHGAPLILHTSVTIGYDVPWRQVESLLLDAARTTEHVLAKPAPFVLQTRLDDFYVAYELNASTDHPEVMAVTYSRLHAAIQDAFAKAGVEIMSPHYRAMRDGNEKALPSLADKPPASRPSPV